MVSSENQQGGRYQYYEAVAVWAHCNLAFSHLKSVENSGHGTIQVIQSLGSLASNKSAKKLPKDVTVEATNEKLLLERVCPWSYGIFERVFNRTFLYGW